MPTTTTRNGSQQEANMSLDNTSHRDELVPSRYAMRVGEIDVLVVSDGVLTALPAATLAVNAGPSVLAAWLDDMVLPPAFDWPVNVVVVRSGDRTVLIDAGTGVEYKDFRQAARLFPRLEAAGIDPASLTDLLLTHMHMDHVGGLLGDGLKERLRPDLRVHASATEVEFWAGKADLSRASMPPGIPDALRSIAKRFLDQYGSRLQTFETEYEVAPGVVASRTGGHTPGHSVVRVESGGERLMFGGDAVFLPGFECPGWHNGFDSEPEETVRVRVGLLRELAATRQPFAGSHLHSAVGRVSVARDVFRWVPTIWAP
jgi:glyoxylase-like metal-dependent hydrolase (beta-lactamase superfamily II)